MNRHTFRSNILVLIAVAVTATPASAVPLNVLQVESDYLPGTAGDQYTPIDFTGSQTVDFAGNPTVFSGGVTYHALSGNVGTYSGHADQVRTRLLTADGAANPVTDIWSLTENNFLFNFVQTASPSTLAFRPQLLGNNIKIVNNSWVDTYTTSQANTDAIRRMDYMIHREDLVMVSGAVSPWGSPTAVPMPLAWASRNGLAVRGRQTFTPSHGDGIGKSHADLWGPKAGGIDDEESSYETPGVAGYAAALLDVAANNGWNNGTNGARHELIKSVLMTGADKTAAAFTTISGGFSSWTSNEVNNLDDFSGAGRADYAASLAVLTGGPQSVATVTGTTVNSPTVASAAAGWWYESDFSGNGTQALIVDLTSGELTSLTATLAWDVTQTETQQGQSLRLNTTDPGVIFADLDLEFLPVTYDGNSYTLGASLGEAGLMSKSTNDNVEHLYFTGALDPGLYAFSISNNSGFDWNYGFSYRAAIVPEPGTLLMLVASLAIGLAALGQRKARNLLAASRP